MPFSRLIANTPETGTLNLAASLMSRRTQRPQAIPSSVYHLGTGWRTVNCNRTRDSASGCVGRNRRRREDRNPPRAIGLRMGMVRWRKDGTPMDEDDDEAIMAPTASGWRASNIIAWSNGRARSGAPRVSAMRPDFRLSIGAGEGIRTLDPNLGKVVLYP
jgi:hypothetical protein